MAKVIRPVMLEVSVLETVELVPVQVLVAQEEVAAVLKF
jgi:hypothetical protein